MHCFSIFHWTNLKISRDLAWKKNAAYECVKEVRIHTYLSYFASQCEMEFLEALNEEQQGPGGREVAG